LWSHCGPIVHNERRSVMNDIGVTYDDLETEYLKINRVKVYLECRNCGHTWAVNLQNGKLPEGYNVCIACARKEKLQRLQRKDALGDTRDERQKVRTVISTR
jgi:hypothetical protein